MSQTGDENLIANSIRNRHVLRIRVPDRSLAQSQPVVPEVRQERDRISNRDLLWAIRIGRRNPRPHIRTTSIVAEGNATK